MPIDRTWWNALVDDTGAGTTGTIWDKAAIKGLLDAIDAMGEVDKVWTPTVLFGAANPGMTFSTKIGKYSRADQIVLVELQCVMTAKGTGTGIASITGLPYAGQTVNAAGLFDVSAGFVNLPGQPIVVVNGTTLYVMAVPAAGTTRVSLTEAHFGNACSFSVAFAYRKA